MFSFFVMPARAAGLALVLALASAPLASAHDYKVGDLVIGHPWSRATPPGAKVAAGYLSVQNNGTTPDRLLSVASEISGKGEIHEMSVDANTGVMTMRPVTNGIAIPAGETIKLEPGGYHLMFVDLTEPSKEGVRFKGTLTFEQAGTVEVDYAVEAPGGRPDARKPARDAGNAAGHSGHAHEGGEHTGQAH